MSLVKAVISATLLKTTGLNLLVFIYVEIVTRNLFILIRITADFVMLALDSLIVLRIVFRLVKTADLSGFRFLLGLGVWRRLFVSDVFRIFLFRRRRKEGGSWDFT
jgi:hypothetical protein